jgi:hypothetical protein
MGSLDTEVINKYFRKFNLLESDLINIENDIFKLEEDIKILVLDYDQNKYNDYTEATNKTSDFLSNVNNNFIDHIKILNDMDTEMPFFENIINNISDTIFIQHKKIQNIKLLLLKYKCQNEIVDDNYFNRQEINNAILDTIILNLKFVKNDIPNYFLAINKYDTLQHLVIIVEIYRKKYNRYKEHIKGKNIEPNLLFKMLTIDTLFKTVDFFG